MYLFDSYEEACDYLQKMWQHCYNDELTNSVAEIDVEMTYHEEDYAQIKWENNRRAFAVLDIDTNKD